MQIVLPKDLEQRIQLHIERGDFPSAESVVFEALRQFFQEDVSGFSETITTRFEAYKAGTVETSDFDTAFDEIEAQTFAK